MKLGIKAVILLKTKKKKHEKSTYPLIVVDNHDKSNEVDSNSLFYCTSVPSRKTVSMDRNSVMLTSPTTHTTMI